MTMYERSKADPLFAYFMSGEKQRIFTGEIAGVPFRAKLDSYMTVETTSEYLQLLKDYKAMRAMQYGISSIGIFGSVARGEHTEGSDVDICVDLKTPSLFYMVHIKEELQQLFGNPVDIIRIRPEMDALLKRDIMREGIYA